MESNRVSKHIESEWFKNFFKENNKKKIMIYITQHEFDLEECIECIECTSLETNNWMYFKTENSLLHIRKSELEYIKYFNKLNNINPIEEPKIIKIYTKTFEIEFIGWYIGEHDDHHNYLDSEGTIYHVQKNKMLMVLDISMKKEK